MGKQAGEPIADIEKVDVFARGPDPDNLYYPFEGETQYAIAQWLLRNKCSKGGVDDLAKNPDLQAIRPYCGFSSAEEWQGNIEAVPWGIEDDHWLEESFTIRSDIVGARSPEYTVRFRNVINVIQFLLGHGPFQDCLVYAPVQQFNADNDRLWSEMHTGDWWWETQEKLPDGATAVPLLLSTDKTVLTQHHGDLSVWPVYLTVGNLDKATRMSQTRPGFVLLGIIPVVKIGTEYAEYLKHKVYHTAMGLILKREFSGRV